MTIVVQEKRERGWGIKKESGEPDVYDYVSEFVDRTSASSFSLCAPSRNWEFEDKQEVARGWREPLEQTEYLSQSREFTRFALQATQILVQALNERRVERQQFAVEPEVEEEIIVHLPPRDSFVMDVQLDYGGPGKPHIILDIPDDQTS
jgi:hypothetical protein